MSGSNPPDRTDRLLAGNRAHDTAGEQIPHSTRPAPQLVRPSRSAAKLGERTMAAPKPKKQKTAKRKEVEVRDLYNFMTGKDELAEAKKAVRAIIDDEPIDLVRLETNLREALAAIQKIRSNSISNRMIQELMISHEKHYASLLLLIVGKQH